MNDLDKAKIEVITSIVRNTVQTLSTLFKLYGMKHVQEVTDPSLEELLRILRAMEAETLAHEEYLQSKDDNSVAYTEAAMYIQNIKQGVLFASNLILEVKRNNEDRCNEASNSIEKNQLPDPLWSGNDDADEK